MRPLTSVLALLALLGLAACAGAPSPPPDALDPCFDGRPSQPAGPGDNPYSWICEAPPARRAPTSRAVLWVRGSGEYAGLVREAYRAAAARLKAMKPKGTWFVVMDADETILDNARYQAEREACGLAYTPETWCDWSRAEAAGLLPGAEAFMRKVHEMGGLIVIVTNRCEGERAWTESRLMGKDGGALYDLMLMRGPMPASIDDPPQPVCDGTTDKTRRFRDAAERLRDALPFLGRAAGKGTPRPVMWIGDQIGDFPRFAPRGEIVGTLLQGDRAMLAERGLRLFERPGTAFVLIPNPMYGKWEASP